MAMKLLFIETKANVGIDFPEKLASKLPKRLCLAASVQFSHQLPQLQQQLKGYGKETSLLKARHSKHVGQILGCGYSKMEFDSANTDAFLYVGDGMFHPETLLLGSDKDVYTFDPFTKEFKMLGREWAERIRKKEKGALLTFLSSDNIGVVVTVKPGQLGVQVSFKQIFSLQQKFPAKKFYYLVCDTVDFTQLRNFPFVQCFVNTACHRMLDDYDKFPKPVINIEEMLKLASAEIPRATPSK
ncbi:diphthamide synthesis protein [Candidatus Woesearchaeota archaeon]|nr:diphthamide synthesis protein [Candidatus Woesearchaeota archaeon]